MNTFQITAALSIVLLFAAPVHARGGGWDANGVATSGVAQGVLPEGARPVQVRTVELPIRTPSQP